MVTGAAVVFLVAVGRARAEFGLLMGLLITVAITAAFVGLWVWVSASLPSGDVPWTAFVPGAVLLTVGFQLLNVATALFLADRLASSSELYGALGIAATALFYLYLLGRLVVWGAELNAVMWWYSHPDRPNGTGPPPRGSADAVTSETSKAIEPAADQGRATRKLVGRGLFLIISAVSLYLLMPSLLDVFTSWRELFDLRPEWIVAALLFEAACFVCIWELQRIALRTRSWFTVACSQLAGNAFGRVVPGGAAPAAALQYRMLVRAGVPARSVASGLTATTLLNFGLLLALPVLSLPSIFGGTPVDRGLAQTAYLGGGVFVLDGRRRGGRLHLGAAAPGGRADRRADRKPDLPPPAASRAGSARSSFTSATASASSSASDGGSALLAATGRWLFDFADPARMPSRGRCQAKPIDRAAGLRGRFAPRNDLDHPGRARARRGGPHRHARAGRGRRRRGGRRHAGLPARVLLASDPRGSRGVLALQAPIPRASPDGHPSRPRVAGGLIRTGHALTGGVARSSSNSAGRTSALRSGSSSARARASKYM